MSTTPLPAPAGTRPRRGRPHDAQVRDRRREPLGDAGDGARVGVERLELLWIRRAAVGWARRAPSSRGSFLGRRVEGDAHAPFLGAAQKLELECRNPVRPRRAPGRARRPRRRPGRRHARSGRRARSRRARPGWHPRPSGPARPPGPAGRRRGAGAAPRAPARSRPRGEDAAGVSPRASRSIASAKAAFAGTARISPPSRRIEFRPRSVPSRSTSGPPPEPRGRGAVCSIAPVMRRPRGAAKAARRGRDESGRRAKAPPTGARERDHSRADRRHLAGRILGDGLGRPRSRPRRRRDRGRRRGRRRARAPCARRRTRRSPPRSAGCAHS